MSHVTEKTVALDMEFGMTANGLLRMTVHNIPPDDLFEVLTQLGIEAKSIVTRLEKELAATIKAQVAHLANNTEGEIND